MHIMVQITIVCVLVFDSHQHLLMSVLSVLSSNNCLLNCYDQCVNMATHLDMRVASSKSTWVDLDLPSGVKSVCSGVTVEIFWRRQSHCKSFQVDLMRQMLQRNHLCGNINVRYIANQTLERILSTMKNCFADINNCNNFQYFVTERYTIFSSRLTTYHENFR